MLYFFQVKEENNKEVPTIFLHHYLLINCKIIFVRKKKCVENSNGQNKQELYILPEMTAKIDGKETRIGPH